MNESITSVIINVIFDNIIANDSRFILSILDKKIRHFAAKDYFYIINLSPAELVA